MQKKMYDKIYAPDFSLSYKVGDHFTGTGGELVITGLNKKDVFYYEVGDTSLEGSIMDRQKFDDAIRAGTVHSQREETVMEKAMRLIDQYCIREFESHAEIEDPTRIPIGHTTITDDELPIQVYADLVNFKIERYILNVPVETRQYEALSELIHWELDGMDFNDLSWFTDEQIAFAVEHESEYASSVGMTMHTHGMAIANVPGTWRVTDRVKIQGETFWMMLSVTDPQLSPIIVDNNGILCLKNAGNGFDAHNLHLLSLEVMSVPQMPDDTITVMDMKAYGYAWGGMLPMRADAAVKVFTADCPVYRLYEDNTEGLVETDAAEISAHAANGGIFGIEKPDWLIYLAKHSA